jgi:aminoglycoside phosphotransferase (APT) family kinase protein
MNASVRPAADILVAAGQLAGVDVRGAELIRDGSNVLYRTTQGAVARIGKPGSKDVAELEVRVSRWLTEVDLPVVQLLPDVPQPTVVEDRPVTWWVLLPEHRPATPAELGAVLRTLHALPVPPELDLPHFDPFTGLAQRITETPGVSNADRVWLAHHLVELRERYDRLDLGEPTQVVHGDAWQGNVAVLASGEAILLDLEKVSIGHVEWDLVQLAVDRTDFARLTADEYQSFVTAYSGYDVTSSSAYRVLADIQELRWVCFVLSKSESSSNAACRGNQAPACLFEG